MVLFYFNEESWAALAMTWLYIKTAVIVHLVCHPCFVHMVTPIETDYIYETKDSKAVKASR